MIPVCTLYVNSFVRPLHVVGCTRSNNDGTMLYFFVVPPSIDKGPTNKTVNESSDLELFCNATGNPPPNITWSKVAVPPVQLSFDEVLTVKNTNKTDSGVYQCRASNGIGSDAFASSVVTVRCKLKKFNEFFLIYSRHRYLHYNTSVRNYWSLRRIRTLPVSSKKTAFTLGTGNILIS